MGDVKGPPMDKTAGGIRMKTVFPFSRVFAVASLLVAASPGSLRGFMLPYEPTEQDFKDMAAMGATLVRYQMTRNTRGFDESRHLDFAAYREYGWDWTYHAFRESPCWDAEKEGPDIKHMVPSADTPRKQALLEGLNR